MADLDMTRLASAEASIDEIEQAIGGPLVVDGRFEVHPEGTAEELARLRAENERLRLRSARLRAALDAAIAAQKENADEQ